MNYSIESDGEQGRKVEKDRFEREDLFDVGGELLSLLDRMESALKIDGEPIERWKGICRQVRKPDEFSTVHTAVVGPIKSGKSTFVNALMGRDYLKRGAGVVTSIVTRIRKGKKLTAQLTFKSWEEVNGEMQRALTLFPDRQWEETEFDIRKEDHREAVASALHSLKPEQWIEEDTRNPDTVLLETFLLGYPEVSGILAEKESLVKTYKAGDFPQHQRFSGDDRLAVYLSDLSLTIDADLLDENTEVADCQGSDSPNPWHMAMIQDYLAGAHLIVYVVSSRTGLRQADIRFLNMLRRMGMGEQILFVVNIDLDEHPGLSELTPLIERIGSEIGRIIPDPALHAFSALHHLFMAAGSSLSEKEQGRVEAWEKEPDLTDYSRAGRNHFLADFRYHLTEKRNHLIFKNGLEKLSAISAAAGHQVRVARELSEQRPEGGEKIVQKIRFHQEKMAGIRSMIRSTLDGAAQRLKGELKTDADRFFDPVGRKSILPDLFRFVENCPVTYPASAPAPKGEKKDEAGRKKRISREMYRIFQEFKRLVDGYMAETVNPEIIRFIKAEEQKILSFFESVTGPYDVMLADALDEYNRSLKGFGISGIGRNGRSIENPDMDRIRQTKKIKLPPAKAAMRYSARIKTEAVIRFGVYSLGRLIKKLFGREGDGGTQIRALKDGVTRLRAEALGSIRFHFKDYRENLKYQYLFKLAHGAADHLNRELVERFGGYEADLAAIADLVGNQGPKKKGADPKALKEIGEMGAAIEKQIEELKAALAEEAEKSDASARNRTEVLM